jgi:hypothetical protein
MPTLKSLTETRGFEILEHLEADAEIPVNSGIQFQGDVAIIPIAEITGSVNYRPSTLTMVPAQGVEVVQGINGGHTHLLVADPGTAFWTTKVTDSEGLAIGVLRCDAPVHMLHAEHGGTGIAPGEYVLRRQREQAEEQRLVAD